MSYHYLSMRKPARSPSFDAMPRATRQRAAIGMVIQAARRPLTPQEVLQGARAAVRALGLATVYRNLKRLAADGTIRVITLPGESPRYEMGVSAHHHHFQCTSCRRVYDIPGCPGNLRRMAPRGFRVEHHDLTLYGRCPDCGRRERRTGDDPHRAPFRSRRHG